MIKQSETTTIGDLQVTTVKHAVMSGLTLKTRLLKIISPALASADKLVNAAKSAKSVADLDIDAIAPMIMAFAAQITPEDVPGIVCQILSCTSVVVKDDNGIANVVQLDRNTIELVFASRPDMDLFKVIGHALKVNFAGFFATARLNA